MFWSKSKNKQLELKINELEYKISEQIDYANGLKKQIKTLNDEIQALQDTNELTALNADMQIDFKKIGAFSIERMKRNNDKFPVTIIGFWRDKFNQTHGEWRLECNDETHARLVKEFREYQKGNK